MIWELSNAEIIALITSFAALIISIRNITISGVFNQKATKKIKKVLNRAQQSVESEINEAINVSFERIDLIKKQLTLIEEKQTVHTTSLYQSLLNETLEDLYKQYDRACNFYWENKINRERFKRIYKSEIIQLMDESHNDHFNKLKGNYPNIKRVYDRWKNSKRKKSSTLLIKFQTSQL